MDSAELESVRSDMAFLLMLERDGGCPCLAAAVSYLPLSTASDLND